MVFARLLGRDAVPRAERRGVGEIRVAGERLVLDAEGREALTNPRLDRGAVVSEHRVRTADP